MPASLPARHPAPHETIRHRARLLTQLVRRDTAQRYRGSLLGMCWSFLTPLLMLAVYTFVFSVVFRARWNTGGPQDDPVSFALILFCGLIVHSLLAECLTRAPGIIIMHGNYVKKVVFPIEILPLLPLGSALFHFTVSFLVLLAAQLALIGQIHATVLLLPLVLTPLVILAAGICWALAALGVYLRDIGQLSGLLATVLLFLSPVFYPAEALPEHFRPLLYANPLTLIIENARAVILWGKPPAWSGLVAYAVFAVSCAFAGYFCFAKTRRGFADVL